MKARKTKNKEEVKRKINEKLNIHFFRILLIVCVFLTIMSLGIARKAIDNTSEHMMPEIAEMSANSVSNAINTYYAVVDNVSNLDKICNPNEDVKEKLLVLEKYREYLNADTLMLTTTNGDIIMEDDNKTNIKDEDFFKKAMEGKINISSPKINSISKNMEFNIASPVNYDGKIEYVLVAAFDVQNLVKMTSDIKIADTGYAYIINEEGRTISDPNIDNIYKNENVFEMVKSDKSLKKLSDIHTKMVNGEEGTSTYRYQGKTKRVAYHKIPNTSWSLAVAVPIHEITKAINPMTVIMIIVCIVIIIIGVITSNRVIKIIVSPLKDLTDRLLLLREGDLNTRMNEITSGDEIETLYLALRETISNICNYIKDIEYVLENIGNGNLDVGPRYKYNGDFIPIENSLKNITSNLNETLKDIHFVSDNVSGEADKASSAAVSLSSAVTEQAASVEEVYATVNNISDVIKQNSQSTRELDILAKNAMDKTNNSNEQMENMVDAIVDIQKASKEISDIINTIDDIATQTNLLALNASIEAARAGEAGKGFAVVADQVKQLALKSKEAANKTTELIEKTINTVDKGTEIIEKTKDSLKDVLKNVENVSLRVDEVSKSSNEQTSAICEVTSVIDGIAQVIQETAENAEQSSRLSEEMAEQAQVLQREISKFKLK